VLAAEKPVVAVCGVRTGYGKSQTSREVGRNLLAEGLKVGSRAPPDALPQRFTTLEDIDASNPTSEEREEYEAPAEMGMVRYAGVDHAAILERARSEADVVIWDGGNNDFSFSRLDLPIAVVDPVLLDSGPSLAGKQVLVIEDRPTITHGAMPFGAGMVAARDAGATTVDPRSVAAGSIAVTLASFPHIGPVVPAMGYSEAQVHHPQATITPSTAMP
jgi:predicted GTPase